MRIFVSPGIGVSAIPLPVGGGGTPTFVQSAHNSTNTAVGSLAATLGAGVGNNNLVRGFVTWNTSTTADLTSVTDDKGNSYTIVDRVVDATQGYTTASFYKEGITNAPTIITAQLNTGGPVLAAITLVIAEYSGIATVSALDGHVGQQQLNPGTGTDVITSGNITTSANGNLVCSCVTSPATAVNVVVGTGFTLRETDTTSNIRMKSEELIQTSAGAIPGTWTDAVNGGASVYTTMTMAFKHS